MSTTVYQKIAAFPHFTAKQRLVSAVTEFDQAEERRARGGRTRHNPYAIGMYGEAAAEAAAGISQGRSVRAEVVRCFTGRLADAVLVACGEPKRTPQEARSGA